MIKGNGDDDFSGRCSLTWIERNAVGASRMRACVCVCVKWCFWGNTILVWFTEQKQSLHYPILSLTTRQRFIPVPLSVKTLGCECPNSDSESFRCCYFCSPLCKPTPVWLPSAPPLAVLAWNWADHQAITRELGNQGEIQSLKGLNTGRGSLLVASRGDHCIPGWMGPQGGQVWGVTYTRFGWDWLGLCHCTHNK